MRRLLLVLVVTAVGTAALLELGHDSLAGPVGWSPSELSAWLEARGAVAAGIVVLRLAAVSVGLYLVVVTSVALLAELARWRRLAASVRRVTPRALHPLLAGSTIAALTIVGTPAALAKPAPPPDRLVEVGTTTTVLAPTDGAPPVASDPAEPPPVPDEVAPDDPPPVMRLDQPTPEAPVTTAPTTTTTTQEVASSATALVAPARPDSGDQQPSTPTSTSSPPAASTPAPPSTTPPVAAPSLVEVPPTMRLLAPAAMSSTPAPALDTWTIEPGESFWSVASSLMADHLGRPPSEGEVDRYWRQLMAANPTASPTGDPDLLFSGTVLVLPPTN